ncbi:MAG: acylphosphatase [Capsulimonadales bacterium]|nr:acylphosphatase [Capsulimonadales bacterium]
MSVHRLHAIVHGRVQGVGYRYWAHHTAHRLPGIAGYVKNLPDGSVEVLAECQDRTPLDVLLHELHVGPEAAQVTEVTARWEEGNTLRHSGFHVA